MNVLPGLKYSFPHHLISLLLILSTALVYPLVIFNSKKIKYIGLIISVICISIFSFVGLTNSPYYEATLKCSSDSFKYDDSYKVYLENEKYGTVSLKYYDEINDYCIEAIFHTTGNTKLILDDQKGNVTKYDLSIGKNTYELNISE